MQSDDPASIDDLLVRRAWVEDLARSLLRPAELDDAVQDAALAVLAQPAGTVRSVRPWLARVLRNFALKRRRGEERRSAHEVRAPEREPIPTPAELVERAALEQDVIRAVLELDEPYRSTVLLFYFEGVPSAEIAARAAISEAAVRQRLKRAREELRESLGARYGHDEHRLHAQLALLATRARATRGAPTGPPTRTPDHTPRRATHAPQPDAVALRAFRIRIAWGVAALFVASGAWLGSRGGSSPSPDPRAALRAQPAGVQPAGATDAPALVAPERDSARSRDAKDDRAPFANEGAFRAGVLACRVHRARDGRPAENAVVLVRRMDGGAPYPDEWSGRTDRDGRVQWANLEPGELRVGLLEAGDDYTWVAIRAGETASIELAIPLGITVNGTVRDDRSREVASAEIWLSECWQSIRGHVVSRADEHGRFRLLDVQPDGLHWLGARAAGFAPSPVRAFEGVPPGSETEIEIVLGGSGGRLRGTVRDDRGAPIAAAEVLAGIESNEWARSEHGAPPQRVTTDARGEFAFESLPCGMVPIQARARGCGPCKQQIAVTLDRESAISIELRAEARVRGVVADERGAPLADVSIHSRSIDDFACCSTRSDALGRFELAGLEDGVVPLTAERRELGRDSVDLELRAGEVREWNPALAPRPRIFGTLVDARGERVPGVELVVFRGASDEWSRMSDVRWITTDGDGAFDVDVALDARYAILVNAPDEDFPSVIERGLSASLRPLTLRLADPVASAGSFTAAVELADGSPAAACELHLCRRESAHGAGFHADAQGRAFVRAPSGTYSLEIRSEAAPWEPLGERTLAPGETVDLGTIRLREPALVHGTFRWNGATLPALDLRWTGAERTRSIGEGRVVGRSFRSPPLAAGGCVLTIQAAGVRRRVERFSIADGVDRERDVELVPALTRSARFECAVRTVRPDWIEWRVLDAGDVTVADGRAAFPVEGALEVVLSGPPGTYRLEGRASDDSSVRGDFEWVEGPGGAEPLRFFLSRP